MVGVDRSVDKSEIFVEHLTNDAARANVIGLALVAAVQNAGNAEELALAETKNNSNIKISIIRGTVQAKIICCLTSFFTI